MSIVAGFMVPHPPLIVPQVGRGNEAQIEETIFAYEQVAEEIASFEPDTILISSPHSVMYADYFHISPGRNAFGSFEDFGAPEVCFQEEYDSELVREICTLADEAGFPAGMLGEKDAVLDHGTMVPLYFIRKHYKYGKIIRIGLSGLPLTAHYELGMLIQKAVNRLGRRAVYVASGDLSHKLQPHGPYGFAEEGPEYDKRIMDVCSRAAFGELFDFKETFCEKAAECGHRSFVIMAGAFDGMAVDAKALSHQDVTGVGYGICDFFPNGEDPQRHFLERHLAAKDEALQKQRVNEDAYVRLARASLEAYVRNGEQIEIPSWVPEEMRQARAGVFVSIHEHDRLRGCIGTIAPYRDSIAEEIIQNAISACSRDPRFSPIEPEELAWLELHVDVLGDPEPVNGPEELDVKRYGVIVSKGSRRGLLLPDLDGVETPKQQIEIAKQKAGIREDEEVRLERFEVVRHY